jgi:hypothetical protein
VKVLSGFPGIVVVILIILAFLSHTSAAEAWESSMKKYFQGSDAEKMLEQALEQDVPRESSRPSRPGPIPIPADCME